MRFDNDKNFFQYKNYPNATNVISGIEFLKDYVDIFNCISTESCFKIFKKSFLIDNEINYPEGVYFEDAVFSLRTFLKAQRILHIIDEIYFYRTHGDSTMANYLATSLKMADWVNYLLQSIDILKVLKNSETRLYKQLLHHYIYYVNDIRIKVIYLSLSDKSIFFRRLQKLEVRRIYFGFYYNYMFLTFGALLKEFLRVVKIKFPTLWNFARKMNPKLI